MRPRKLRKDYVRFSQMTTRWRDNDAYGHMNNAVYYEYVDACVSSWLVTEGGMATPNADLMGLAVETGCVFHAPLGWPDPVWCGLAVAKIGTTSVRYEVGLFDRGDQAAAEAHFVHVYVDPATKRPTPLPQAFRDRLQTLTR